MGQLTITQREFQLLRELIYQEAGIHLAEHKKLLVITRLTRRLKALGYTNFTGYYTFIKNRPEGRQELREMINRITTNKTSFYREPHHFEYLAKTILPSLRSRGSRNLRLWSAGCSTGPEPYTMAAETLKALGDHPGCDIKILATDLDTRVLEKAKQGRYNRKELEGVPPLILQNFFRRVDTETWEILPPARNLIRFRQFNLMNRTYPFRKGFDVIFCRNVLIYFKPEDKKRIIQNFITHLRPQGHLVLGHSESLLDQTEGLHLVGPTIYQLRAPKEAGPGLPGQERHPHV